MTFLKKEDSSLINVRLTSAGRRFLTQFKKDASAFSLAKFSFGDSEINYKFINDDDLENETRILYPSTEETDIISKIFYRGNRPSGNSEVNLLTSENISIAKNSISESIIVNTKWLPIESYMEEYKWLNLGPLNDWDFSINLSQDTTTGTISSFGNSGTSKIKIIGTVSGAYTIVKLTIT